jgi:hypothetical protein
MRITLLLLFFTQISLAQTAHFGETKKGTYDNYITRAGDTIKKGMQLTLGTPSTDLGFAYISQGGERVAFRLANTTVTVHNIRVYEKPYLQIRGYGLLPVLIDYENAITTGELINPFINTTKEDALKQLQEAKQFFDLELITRKEYDSIRKALSPYILD